MGTRVREVDVPWHGPSSVELDVLVTLQVRVRGFNAQLDVGLDKAVSEVPIILQVQLDTHHAAVFCHICESESSTYFLTVARVKDLRSDAMTSVTSL